MKHAQKQIQTDHFPILYVDFATGRLPFPYDNQGTVETPVQPRYGDGVNAPGDFTGPPPYANQEWKLPKYEEVAGMPPPYTTLEPGLFMNGSRSDTFQSCFSMR